MTTLANPSSVLALVITLVLSSFCCAAAPSPAQLHQQADAAYQAKRYLDSAQLLDQVIALGEDSPDIYYNAACGYARAGDREAAFARLDLALQHGLEDAFYMQADHDLDSLHDDPRWQPLLAKVSSADTVDPRKQLMQVMIDDDRPFADRYLTVRRALQNGVDLGVSSNSTLSQYYATIASFVGDYETADIDYPLARERLNPVAQGYSYAEDALAVVLPLTKNRQAVFLNESHGNADTRAANFALLKPLRQQGFTYLALETLRVEVAQKGGCRNAIIVDSDLQKRGYPWAGDASGYYSNEPVYAEFVREALRLGYRLYAYESRADGPNDIATREGGEAENLACLFKQDPKAKVLLVGGFSHIGENPALAPDGKGWMAYRFKQATGIDPLSIDNTRLLHIADTGMQFPLNLSHSVGAYALRNGLGDLFGDAKSGFDISLYIPPAVAREASPNWLSLGGNRVATRIDAAACGQQRPCLLDAHAKNEPDDAVASDRCVLSSSAQTGCTLYLRPGQHRVRFLAEDLSVLGETVVTAK